MINQRAYPDVILGFGSSSQTFALFGCFVASILDALNTRYGYNYSVAQFNQFLKDRDAFVRPNLISSTRLAQMVGDIFLEGRNEAWNDAKIIQYLNDKENYLVIGEVSGKGIGGSGQHFVKIDRVDVSNGKVTMTYIDDPWGGLEDQKVTTRYNAYGNILSLRVFKIKKKVNNGGNMANMYTMPSGKQVDLSNMESNKVLANVYDEVINRGLWVKVAEAMDKAITFKDAEGQSRTVRWYVTEWANRKDQAKRLEDEKKAIQESYEQLQKAIGEAETNYAKLREADQALIKKQDEQLQEMGKNIGGLQQDKQELNARITTLEAENEELKKGSTGPLTIGDVLVLLFEKLRKIPLRD